MPICKTKTIEMTNKTAGTAKVNALCRKQKPKDFAYVVLRRKNHLYSFGALSLNIFEPRAGTTDSATIKDASKENEIVKAKGTINWRTVPVVNTNGKNTQIEVSVDATIAPVTCIAPCAAARVAESPLARIL